LTGNSTIPTFFFYLPRSEVIEVPMSVDDAAKLVMSAGVIQPEEPAPRGCPQEPGRHPTGRARRRAGSGVLAVADLD
jgi:uncharacterized membrane protein